MHILIVEDEKHDYQIAKRTLDKSDLVCEIVWAQRGEDALEHLQAEVFDIILLDFKLPGISGLEMFQQIIGRDLNLPVVFISGTGSELIAVEALKLGAQDYLVKDTHGEYLKLLPTVVRKAYGRWEDGEAHKRAEKAKSKALAKALQATHALRESEERYRSLFEGVPVGLYRSTPAGRFLDVNPAMVRLLGYPDRESLLKVNVDDIYVSVDDRQRWQAMVDQGGVVQDYKAQFRQFDGASIWGESNAQAIRDQDGQVFYEGTLKDITRRERTEEALRRRNREQILLNRLGQELTATLDLQQVVERLLPAVTEVIGSSGASIWLFDQERTGKLICRAIFHHGQKRSPLDLHLHSGQGIAGWVAETGESAIVPHASGDPRFFPGIDEQTGFHTISVLAVPLWVRYAIVGVLEVVNKLDGDFDAHDRALVEMLAASAAIAINNARLVETQRQHAVELEASNDELDAFARTTAHDLKGPLGYMVGFAQVLEQDYATLPDKEIQDYLQTIAQSGHKMCNIIDELLLLAGVRKMDEIKREALDMSGIVTEAQERLDDSIAEYEAEIILPDAWPAALGYGPWVEEVWVNYFTNALKYGSRPPRIELGADRPSAQPTIRFWIRDNGPGLTQEEQSRLFTPFTRLDRVRAKGHGLGLSIVRRIVEKLGGEVGVESKTGQGSLFWFTLPVAENL
ncbi:MAG: response regulator [Chloroflexi bacterium]|nr:response regulator [Chloroflexota bacterium]